MRHDNESGVRTATVQARRFDRVGNTPRPRLGINKRCVASATGPAQCLKYALPFLLGCLGKAKRKPEIATIP